MHAASSIGFSILTFAITESSYGIPVSGQGTWETTLLGRDIDGHAVASTDANAVFAYDTVLGVTWYLPTCPLLHPQVLPLNLVLFMLVR